MPIELRTNADTVNEAGTQVQVPPAGRGRAYTVEEQLRIERALVDASRLLASAADPDVKAVLAAVGEPLGAQGLFLIRILWNGEDLPSAPPSVTLWHRAGPAAEERWLVEVMPGAVSGLLVLASDLESVPVQRAPSRQQREASADHARVVIPLLSSQDQFFGYLGIEYPGPVPGALDECGRALRVLHDLFVSHFKRHESERARHARTTLPKPKEGEGHYRSLMDVLSEAVWCIDLVEPLETRAPLAAQVAHILEHGILTECNEAMVHLLGAREASAVIGQRARIWLRVLKKAILEDFILERYRLRHRAFSVNVAGSPPRHFVLQAFAVPEEGGRIRQICGSCTEVTEHVMMERRLVALLEEEDQRIGRDLHDSVGQLMTGIRILSSNLATDYLSEADRGFTLAQKIARLADEASQHIHDIYRGLIPPQLYQGSLLDALETLAAFTDSLQGITCTFEHIGYAYLTDNETKVHLYRIAQEAVNNALKHAGARHIWIVLRSDDGLMTLHIRDDGAGFDARAVAKTSLGLSSMAHRANSIGAKLQVESRPGAGTTVTCTFRRPALEESAFDGSGD